MRCLKNSVLVLFAVAMAFFFAACGDDGSSSSGGDLGISLELSYSHPQDYVGTWAIEVYTPSGETANVEITLDDTSDYPASCKINGSKRTDINYWAYIADFDRIYLYQDNTMSTKIFSFGMKYVPEQKDEEDNIIVPEYDYITSDILDINGTNYWAFDKYKNGNPNYKFTPKYSN